MLDGKTAFVVVDVQQGFKTDPRYFGVARSNPACVGNISSLLESYRALATSNPSKHQLFHVQHASVHHESPLHPDAVGFAFEPFAQPHADEAVVRKNVNSGFIGTNLEALIRSHFADAAEGSGTLYIAGITTDHCVSTTTRMAGNLQVAGPKGEVVLIGDATAAFQKSEASPFDADTIQRVHLESLQEFAIVTTTAEVLRQWRTTDSA